MSQGEAGEARRGEARQVSRVRLSYLHKFTCCHFSVSHLNVAGFAEILQTRRLPTRDVPLNANLK